MAVRTPLDAHFEHFWGLLAKSLSGGLWRFMLSTSWAFWPNGYQDPSGSSFWALLEPTGQTAFRRPLKAHFEYFWGLLAKWLSGGLWKLILNTSGVCWLGYVPDRFLKFPYRFLFVSPESVFKVPVSVFIKIPVSVFKVPESVLKQGVNQFLPGVNHFLIVISSN